MDANINTKALGASFVEMNSQKTSTQLSAQKRSTTAAKTPQNTALNELDETQNVEQTDLEQLAEQLNARMQSLNKDLRFAFSDDTEKLFIQVKERVSGKVLHEFPSEKLRELAGYYIKNAAGMLVDKEG